MLGHRVAAPSTLGTFLRAFTFGHVRQLDRVLGESIERAWRTGAGPGKQRLVLDVDSFVGEVHGYHKQGAAFGYTRQRGYHPLLASRADTGEVLHIRLRKGSANTARGALRFIEELIARVERAGASGEKLLRADSGFWSTKVFQRLERVGWRYSVGVRCSHTCAPRLSRSPITPGRARRLPAHQRGADRRDRARRTAADRASRPPLDARASCYPAGSTTRSSPTAPRRLRLSRQSTASTPSSSSASAT